MAAKSSIDDVVVAVVDVARMVKGRLEEAWGEDTVVAVARNTFVGFVVIGTLVVRTSYVARVQRERPLKLENSTEAYDTRSGDRGVATFVRLP